VNQAGDAAGAQNRNVNRPKAKGYGNVYNDIHPHIFRSYWRHCMRRGGVRDPPLLEYAMGHSLGWQRAYERYDGEIVREAFAKAEPHMTVMSFKVESEKPQPRDMPPSPQRIVAEPELESLLSNRWRFVATLPSGKIVVESLTPN